MGVRGCRLGNVGSHGGESRIVYRICCRSRVSRLSESVERVSGGEKDGKNVAHNDIVATAVTSAFTIIAKRMR